MKRKNDEVVRSSWLPLFFFLAATVFLLGTFVLSATFPMVSSPAARPTAFPDEPARFIHFVRPSIVWAEAGRLYQFSPGDQSQVVAVKMSVSGAEQWDIAHIYDIETTLDGRWMALLVRVNRPYDIQVWMVDRSGRVVVQQTYCSCGAEVSYELELNEYGTITLWSPAPLKPTARALVVRQVQGDFVLETETITKLYWKGILVRLLVPATPVITLK